MLLAIKNKVFYGQEPPSGEFTIPQNVRSIEQLLAVIEEGFATLTVYHMFDTLEIHFTMNFTTYFNSFEF